MAELSFEDFAGGSTPPDTSSSSLGKSFSPANQSFEEFSGGTSPSPSSPFALDFDKTLNGLKAMGGEAAAVIDLVASVPGFILGTGAALGGTVQAAARGVPFSADPKQLNPVTAYGVGREAGHTFGAPFMNPVKKVLDLFRSGKAYEEAKTTQGMEKLTSMIEEAGLWAEKSSGGRISRDAVPMLAETLMASAAGIGGGKGKPAIDPAMARRMREQAKQMREQAEIEAQANTLTPEEFVVRVPVQAQINEMLGIRSPAEQARITRQRRKDAQQAFAREPEAGGDYGSAAESAFRADERLSNEAIYREGLERDRIGGEPYEVGSRPPNQDRIGQAEILRILQKPGHQRSAEDLITLREARKQGGNTTMEAQMLLGAAGIGATVGATLDDDALRGAVLGGAAAMSPLTLMRGPGKVSRRTYQEGAVKGPGGMWHPEAVERLSKPLASQLAGPLGVPAYRQGIGNVADAIEGAKASEAWSTKAIRNYLNRYAGTEKDPLKDVEIPVRNDIRRWEEAWDEAVGTLPAERFTKPDPISGTRENFPEAFKAPPDEKVFGLKGNSIFRSVTNPSTDAIGQYLSHVGDYLRQNVDPAKLQQYDLVRAVRETAANDARVAKQMEKAQSDSTRTLPVHKAYPDGFKWVELKLPEKLTEEQGKQVRELKGKDLAEFEKQHGTAPDGMWEAIGPDGKPLKNSYTGEIARAATPEEAWLAGRLAEEGNTMGHCVGGYCPSVARGESKIFSLRDPKGKSHVTVEVSKGGDVNRYSPEEWFENLAGDELRKKIGDMPRRETNFFREMREWRQRVMAEPAYNEWLASRPNNIEQIKGKQNRAPNKEYLPYVQDFVREGKWGDVGDLGNTGLIERTRDGKRDFYTSEELAKLDNDADFGPGPGGRQEGKISQELVVGLTGLGLGGLAGWAMTDDPSGALLGALAAGSLALPGVRNRLKQAADTVDYGLGAISTRLGNISEPLKLKAREYERRVLMQSHEYLTKVVPFMKEMQKIAPSRRGELERAILTNDASRISELIKGNQPLVAAWREVRNTLHDLGSRLQGHGRFKTMLDDYFPRLVKDVEGLKAALAVSERTRLEQALLEGEKRAMKSRGTPLTSIEQSAIINREIQGFHRAKGYQPEYAKPRSVEEVTAKLQPFYHTPAESLYAYTRGAVQDIEMARFFGRDLVQTEVGKQKHTNIEASVGNLVGRELAEGKINQKQAQELIKMLQSRFQAGERSPNRLVQEVRNLGNMGLLGNIVSAATQMADTALAIYAQDLRSTMTAVARQLTGKEKVSARDFGLADHIAEEFVSQTKTADWLNKMFKYSGFSAIDRFGKTTHLNAALARGERLSRTPGGIKQLQTEYGKAFGDEFPSLVNDLKRGELTERVRSYLFSELSDMQPVSKTEMPQAYLDNPNGRLIYMLKTFMLKQMDVVRRDSYNEIKKGNVGKGVKNLTEYALILGFAGASTDMVKDWLMGRKVNFEATDILENALKTFGWSEYVRAKAATGKPVEALVGAAAPPYRMMDDIIRRDPRAVQYIPILGKLYYSWELGGKERAEIGRYRKDKKMGVEGDLSEEALEYLRKRREKRTPSDGVRG